MRKAYAKDLSIETILNRIKAECQEGNRTLTTLLAKSEVLELSYMGYLISFDGAEPKMGGLSKEDLEVFRGDYDAKLCKIQW